MKKEDLITALKLLKSKRWRAVFSATAYSYPIFRSFKKSRKGGLRTLYPNNFNKRSQDFSPVFHDAGQFCWAKPQDWINKKLGFNNKSTIVELPSWRAQDIDTSNDWKRAELNFKSLQNK